MLEGVMLLWFAAGMVMASGHATQPPLPLMTLLSFAALAAGLRSRCWRGRESQYREQQEL